MIPIIVALEDSEGRPIMPDGLMNASEHTTETKALSVAASTPRAVGVLKYTTGTNRQRFRVLVPVMSLAELHAARAAAKAGTKK